MVTLGLADFIKANDHAIKNFENNQLFRLIKAEKVTLKHYQEFLLSIFHQTFHAAVSFASAGANCSNNNFEIRDYLIKHAEEEHSHWRWVLEDLKNIGYKGSDPRSNFPNKSCSSYIAFNFYLATRYPIARLGAAAAVEVIGAGLGAKYGKNLIQQLKLKPEQMKFVMSHSITDVEHVGEIFDLLKESELTQQDWSWMIYAATMAARLYRDMYDEIASLQIEKAA